MDTEVVEVQEVKSLQGQEHILLVDDEHVNLTLQKRMMERLGYKVSAFSDGNEALKMLEKDSGEFDLLITDQTMPDISGMQLAEKAVALREEFPVIISSGYADSMRLEQGEDTIISAFIAKPYTKEEISITIRKVLDK